MVAGGCKAMGAGRGQMSMMLGLFMCGARRQTEDAGPPWMTRLVLESAADAADARRHAAVCYAVLLQYDSVDRR